MANPQRENGYTAVANEIMENICKLSLNGTQRRIIDVVWRYTYGFSRKDHDISETFIARATDINVRQIKRELKTLIDSKLILVIKEATKNSTRVIAFNKNYEEWCLIKQVTKKTPGDELDTSRGDKLDTSRGDELDTQENKKKNLKQSNRAEKKINTNTAIINYFREAYKNKFNAAYLPNWGVDGKIIKDFLDAEYTEEYLNGYIDWFLNCDDKFLKSNGYKITLMKTTLSKYQAMKVKEKEKYPNLMGVNY